MKRSLLAVAGLLLLLLLGLGVRPALHTGAQTAAASGFVGSWRVTVAIPGQPAFANLSTYAADGTLLSAQPPVQPAPAGAPFKLVFSSEGHGAWASTRPDTAAITFVVLQTDEQGNVIDTLTVRGTTQLTAGGKFFTGSFVSTALNPAGKVVGGGPGTVQGARITVEPMATPMASPTS